jgi:GTPase SAR1 family protein
MCASRGFLARMSSAGFHHEFKFCIVGPSRVGKTTIKIRATDDIFTESYLATIGPEFVEIVSSQKSSPQDLIFIRFVTMILLKRLLKLLFGMDQVQSSFLKFVDSGTGSEKYSTEAKKNAVMKNCQGALLVFDLTKRSSFEKVCSPP